MLMQHVHEAPPPIHTKGCGKSVPPGIARVVMQALAKDPAARFNTVAEFVDALAEAAVDAGLLTDARALLLGTVWGDELAAPGSFLADLLGASSLPGMEATLPLAVERDPEEEAFLASAPKPFGTTSVEMAPVPGRRRRGAGWLWASLGLLTVVFVGIVVGTWWLERAPRATATDRPVTATEEVASRAPRPTESIADVATDQPAAVVETMIEETPEPELVPEVEPATAEVEPEVEAPLKSAAPRRRPGRRKATTGKAAAPAPAKVPAPEAEPSEPVEEDGIDWTVPGFPEEEGISDEGSSSESSAPAEPPPPTGTPDVPPRNPVVIDEVPVDASP
jgi:serine/threonine-protein kinase